jgi:hypothetical protein
MVIFRMEGLAEMESKKLKKREKQIDRKEKTEQGIRQEGFKGINREH